MYVCASVCLSVCPTRYLRNHTRDLYQFFCACCIWPWLGDEIPRGRGNFGVFPPHWQRIVTRSLQIALYSSRTDHSVGSANNVTQQKGSFRRHQGCTARANCDLRLRCCLLWQTGRDVCSAWAWNHWCELEEYFVVAKERFGCNVLESRLFNERCRVNFPRLKSSAWVQPTTNTRPLRGLERIFWVSYVD